MELVGCGLVLPYSVLWMFCIWWLIKPIYFPFYDKDKLPSRSSVLWITVVIYIAMTVAIMLSVDLENTTQGVASNSEMLVFFISLVLVILLGVWSYRLGNNRSSINQRSGAINSQDTINVSQSTSVVQEEIKPTYTPTSIPNEVSSETVFGESPELTNGDFKVDDSLDLVAEPWTTKHDDADFQIGIYNNNADLKLYYCKIDDLYKNKKGDWVVGVIDTKNYTDKTFNIHKIDDLEDKLGIRYVLYEDMVQAFADELGIEIDVWGEEEEIFEVTDEVEETPPKSEAKVPVAPRKRVPKEDPSHSMVYVDSKGNLSEREINLRNVEAKDGKLYVHAYCFKRKRLRTFVAKNIVSLHDLTTKQTFTDEDEVYNELLSWVLENE